MRRAQPSARPDAEPAASDDAASTTEAEAVDAGRDAARGAGAEASPAAAPGIDATPADSPAEWLAGWVTTLAGLAPADAAGTPGDMATRASSSARPGARPVAVAGAIDPAASEPERSDTRRDDIQGRLPAAEATAVLSAATAPAHDSAPARESSPVAATPALGPAPRPIEGVATPTASVAAPVHSPAFAQALSAQVSVFARDGVQQAELRLNPAELGPLGVHIELDGTQAQVSFHAGVAGTREAIERSLPELAAALREQGLNLAGGGVFDQPRERWRAPDGQTTPSTSALSGDAGAGASAAAGVGARADRQTQGLVDVFA